MDKTIRCSEPIISSKIKQRGLIVVLVLLAAFLVHFLPLFKRGSVIPLLSSLALANEPLVKLSEEEIARQLQDLPGWRLEDQKIRRTYQFKNFVESVAFVNRLVEPAEKAGHHPDITISYNQVIVSLTTHDAGGVTQQDLNLAQVISQITAQTVSPPNY